MSLTSFLRIKEVQSIFQETFPLPELELPKAPIQASPYTENYGLVGTAFDYLLRFYVEWLNPDITTTKVWVADHALARIYNITAGWDHDVIMDLVDKVERILVKAVTVQTEFLSTGNVTDDLIVSALLLAQLDPIYRGRRIRDDIGEVNVGDVRDLYGLLSAVTPADWIAEHLCLLNPTFGHGSALVLGADADIVLDTNLIDIKTSKYLTLRPEYYHQLIGYYVLWFIAGDEWPGLPPETLSIYFSRYGVFAKIKTSEIFSDKERLIHFAARFSQMAMNRYHNQKETSLKKVIDQIGRALIEGA